MKKLNKKGFTIVELVIVIAVIAILAGVLIPTFATVVEKANESKAMQEAKNEYEAYLAEYAEKLTGEESYVIVSGEYAFKVVEGQFNSNALKAEEVTHTGKYDLSAFKETTDTAPKTGKTYYTKDANGQMTANNALTEFTSGTTYYEAFEVGSAKVAIYAA